MSLDATQIAALEDAFRRGAISAEDYAAAMGRAAKDVRTSSGTFVTAFGEGTSKISGGVESFTKSMANGAQGASAFGGLVTGAAAGLGNFSEVLGKLGPVGTALSESLKGVANFGAEYVVRALKQSDDLFTSFQGLSKIGGAGQEGMKGIFDNMQKLGMSMNQLQEFTALITKNSEALALMGGTVAEGTKKFASVASGIEQSGLQTQFERMGISVQAQNEGIANYLKIQTMTSAGQVKTTEQLTAGATEYLYQQDKLSRLTGKSADTLAKEEQTRMANERYAATQLELQMKADAMREAGDEKGAKAAEDQIVQNRELLARTPKALQQGVQDMMSGFVNSPEAQKMYIALPEMSQAIISQNFEASKVLEAGAKEADANTKRNIGLAKAGMSDKVMANYGGQRELAVMKPGEGAKTAKTEQTTQATGAGDADVNNQVAMREAQRTTAIAMDNLVEKGVGPLTKAMTTAATEISLGITDVLGPKLVGEKTALNRKPTEKETAEGVKPEDVVRGKLVPGNYESKFEVTPKDLADAWQNFLSKVMLEDKKPATTTDNRPNVRPAPVPPNSGPNIRPSPVVPAPETNIRPTPGTNIRPAPGTNIRPAPGTNIRPAPVVPGSRGAGPAYRAPKVLEETRPENQTGAKPAAAAGSTELATVFSEGIKTISRGQSEQQQTLDELVELMRRSVGVQGKLLQTSRA